MRSLVADILVGLVAFEHFYFLVLEMFLWTKPAGRRAFGTTAEDAERTKTLAANQGLYNGFLAAGLVWSYFAGPLMQTPLRVFFLVCVIVAGLYGGASVAKKIIFIQAAPAAAALAAVLI